MTPVRLADLLAGLSRFADLGFGLPVGTAVRSGILAARLADAVDLPPADAQAAYYTALLHHLGCVGYAHETAKVLGDELVVNAAAARTDLASPRDLVTTFLPALTRETSPVQRARLTAAFTARGGRWGRDFTDTACEVGHEAARRLGLPEPVAQSLLHVFDLWQGERGRPRSLQGAAIPVGARVARITGVAALFDSLAGPEVAVETVRSRAGGMLDPDLASAFTTHADAWLADLAGAEAYEALLDAEPGLAVRTTDTAAVAAVFADLADLKSPWLAGHSRAVSSLAVGAAERLDLPPDTVTALRLAGLLHDVGRVAVSNAVWDKPGRLTADEWEQVRLHPYHSERILAGSGALSTLAPLVGRHHECLDGSGYHRGCTARDLHTDARVLAAAATYRTKIEPRPHRPALTRELARDALHGRVRRGELDPDAVGAVLQAAGHRAPRQRPRLPAGLSEREAEVLTLLARGRSNGQIADRLVVSRRTAEHHVQHVYAKIGVTGRAAATLFAVEHGLVGPDGRDG